MDCFPHSKKWLVKKRGKDLCVDKTLRNDSVTISTPQKGETNMENFCLHNTSLIQGLATSFLVTHIDKYNISQMHGCFAQYPIAESLDTVHPWRKGLREKKMETRRLPPGRAVAIRAHLDKEPRLHSP